MARKERVTNVIDGDTFQTNRRKHPVRLSGVDAPEKGQKGASQATKDLKKLIENKEVSITPKARDTYSRTVALVNYDGKSVNKAMKTKVKSTS